MADECYSDTYTEALSAAARWHADHRRKGSGVPYISHLLEVSALVWADGGTESEAIAGLLHDAVEDGKASLSEIRASFGSDVATIVENCSDSQPGPGAAKAPWFGRKVQHLGHLRFVVAAKNALPTMRVVGGDKLSNLRSMMIDHRHAGSDFWGRFSGGLGGSAWYYHEMASLVAEAMPGSMLGGELLLAVDEIAALMAARAAEFDGADRAVLAGLDRVADTDGFYASPYLAFELVRVSREGLSVSPDAASTVLARWFGAGTSGSEDPGPSPDRLIEIRDAVAAVVTS